MQQQYPQTVRTPLSPPAPQPLHPGLEALDDGFFMVDASWQVTYLNAAAERLLSLPRHRVVGGVLWQVLPFLADGLFGDVLRRVREEGRSQRFMDVFPGRHGGFASVHAAALDDGGLAVQFRDATEEVKSAERHTALLDSIQDGFVAVDADWRVVYMNQAAEGLLGLRWQQGRTGPLWALLPREPVEIGECLRATMADGVRRHLSAVRPKGRVFRNRVYDLWTYALTGGGISILFEDVSERVEREEQLASLAAEAVEANQVKSRFFAAINHELRTPLNAIIGYTHLLETGTYGRLPDPARRAAERTGVCAEHLARLVDDLLLLTASELSRVPVNVSAVSLDSFLPRAVEPYRHQAEAKGLWFNLELPDVLPSLETDAERLRQLLAGVLANAVRFTSRGGISLAVRRYDDELEISVTDTGCGIDPADWDRIFAPFEQVADSARSDPLVRGTGLGLTIARQLATLLGGRLFIASSSDQGSRFALRLPRAAGPAAAVV